MEDGKWNMSARKPEITEDDLFRPDEADRRMKETMRRMFGQPATMNMTTGQNVKPPFLSAAELKNRGYPCECGFD